MKKAVSMKSLNDKKPRKSPLMSARKNNGFILSSSSSESNIDNDDGNDNNEDCDKDDTDDK